MNDKHLLIKHGILKEFSINKSLSNVKLNNYLKKLSSTCKTKKEFDDKVKKLLLNINADSVPGTIPKTEADLRNEHLNNITQYITQLFIKNNIHSSEVFMVLQALMYVFDSMSKSNSWFEFYDKDGNKSFGQDDQSLDEEE